MFPKESGIYCFENLLDNHKYIGQAENVDTRARDHISFLRKNKDDCIVLQRAWNFYGEESFKIYVIEFCDIQDLEEKEIYYIKELHSHVSEGGYNISWGGKAFMRGRHHTEDSKRRISENSTIPSGELNAGYGKPVPEERRLRISAGLLKFYETHEDSRIGTHQSNEWIQKRADIARGKKRKKETGDRISEGNIGRKVKGSSSSYIGVSFNTRQNNWVVRFTFNKQKIYVGVFKTELDAAKAYNNKIIELCGDKAKLNIIPEEKEV
jgi:group I intron endonuclease